MERDVRGTATGCDVMVLAGVGQIHECSSSHLRFFAANKISSEVGSVCAGSQSSSPEFRDVI